MTLCISDLCSWRHYIFLFLFFKFVVDDILAVGSRLPHFLQFLLMSNILMRRFLTFDCILPTNSIQRADRIPRVGIRDSPVAFLDDSIDGLLQLPAHIVKHQRFLLLQVIFMFEQKLSQFFLGHSLLGIHLQHI